MTDVLSLTEWLGETLEIFEEIGKNKELVIEFVYPASKSRKTIRWCIENNEENKINYLYE